MATISSLGVGSGLDLTGLLDQLEKAERGKLEPIVQQQRSYQAKISAFGRLEGALSAFRVAAQGVAELDTFTGVKVSSSGDVLSAVGAEDAQAGTYQVTVHHRAEAYSIAAQGVADNKAQLGAGTLTLTQQNGEVLEIDVAAGASSLEAVRDAINAADGGIAASIVNDGSGSPWRLVLAAKDTGTQATITQVDVSGDLAASLTLDSSTEVAARDASLTVNGISISSQSNTVEGAIQGVTLNLKEAGTQALSIARDSAAGKTAVKGFVDAFNKLEATLNDLTRYDAGSGASGALLGNSTLRSVEARLRSVMQDVLPEGGVKRLQDLGISLQRDGTLKLDEARLDDLLATRHADVAAFFAGDAGQTGFASRIDTALGAMLAPRGLLSTATGGLETSIESLGRRYEQMERSIGQTIDRYRTQFAQLDSMIATMNSTSQYLTQQFDMMNAQLGRNRR